MAKNQKMLEQQVKELKELQVNLAYFSAFVWLEKRGISLPETK